MNARPKCIVETIVHTNDRTISEIEDFFPILRPGWERQTSMEIDPPSSCWRVKVRVMDLLREKEDK